MLTSATWMNAYLDPPADAAEQGELLTRAGFPLEDSEPLSGSDVRQDYEMTSNRGDCTCHTGLAREIAAISGRTFNPPRPSPAVTGPAAGEVIAVTNREPKRCPLYTARVIRGVKVGPSPDWIADRLRAINQIPRNNIVDASNFVLFEMGQPTHVFDLAKLHGPEIIIRMAANGERFLPLGEGAETVKLTVEDLVIADAEVPVALGGVKGGALSAVTEATTDLVLEAATFDPVSVRNTARRFNLETDASYRFERGVHPGQVNAAADRLAELILEVAGGELLDGVVSDGAPMPKQREVTMSTDRCRAILGVPIEDRQMVSWLTALQFEPTLEGDTIRCVVPVHRLDLEREIDLIEEIGRMMGHDNLPVTETIEIRVAPLQSTVLARRAVNDALTGMGFVESVTHGLIAARDATLFLPSGARSLDVADIDAAPHEKSGAVLRPSLLPSLLRVLAHNHDNGVKALRLFEAGATFFRTGRSHEEIERLGLVMDLDDADAGLRPLRGVIERLVEFLLGPEATLEVTPDDTLPWYAPGAVLSASGAPIGRAGLVAPSIVAHFRLDDPPVAAEIDLGPLLERYPPETEAHALPTFPAVERDISVVVAEDVAWTQLRGVVDAANLDHLEAVEFVTTFRGRQIGKGRKSVTMRLRFRAPDHTLQREAVDERIGPLIEAFRKQLGAEIRT